MRTVPVQIAEFRSLINGYKISQIIMTLERLGAFTALADGATCIEDISSRLDVSRERLAPLLNSVVNYGLLEKKGDTYLFTDDAVVLNPHHPSSQNGYIRFAEDVRGKWTGLSALVSGKESGDLNRVTGENASETRNFISAMHVNALPQAKFLVDKFDFGNRRLLDVGAGSGVFSIEIGKAYESAQGVVFDLPGVTLLTEQYIANEELSSRFAVVAGDYHEKIPDGMFDDILMCAVIHQESAAEFDEILKMTRLHLAAGGRLFITSFFLEDSRTGPTFPALFAVEMLVMSQRGKVYTFKEIEEALGRAGYCYERIDEIPGPATLYVAS